MSDVETITSGADQPQPSSGTDEFLGDLDLGDGGANEPSTGSDIDQAEQAEPEAQEAEGEPQAEEVSDDWLPTEQEKEFPPEVLAKYAKRYGYTPEEIASDPRLARALKDKINSDILIQQQRQAAEVPEEPTPEVEQPQAATPAEPAQQYDQFLDSVVSQFDPAAVQKFGTGLWEAMGGTSEQLKELGIDSSKIGSTLARGAIDMITTALPQLMPQVVEQVFPGFARMYESAMYAQQWDGVRSFKAQDGSQPYAKLPAYGTEQFQTVLREAAKQVPGFEDMVFTKNINGRQVALPAHEQARQKYQLLARIVAGQQVNTLPAVKQAVETGKKLAKEADRSRQNAKILGAGQSSNSLTHKPSNNDDIFGEGVEEYRRREKF